MRTELTEKIQNEKRSEPRRAKLRNHRIEIKFVGHPIYQYRVIDVTTLGAGILIKNDSSFFNMIEKGQVIEANFITFFNTPSACGGAKGGVIIRPYGIRQNIA